MSEQRSDQGFAGRIRRSAVSLALVGAVALPSCTYITQRAYEEKLDGIDADGDGAPWHEDCDDRDPLRSPEFPEVAYDGVDNDCAGDGDLVDADGDGYPGITDQAYAELVPPAREPYPDALVGQPLDCADDPVARPGAADIHPGSPTEVEYDGIDSDCDGGNDFDSDGDGYLPIEVDGALFDARTALEAYVEDWGYQDRLAAWAPPGGTAPLPGDCHDFRADVHPDPGVPDVPYDGIDQDCDDANDFDQDGDGFMPRTLESGLDTKSAYEQFVAQFFQGRSPPWILPADVEAENGQVFTAYDDCLDAPHPDLAVDPADVFPRPDRAEDAWYDGIDHNCWADNDFDQDNDGFFPTTVPGGGGGGGDTAADTGTSGEVDVQALYDEYVRVWGYEEHEEEWGAVNGLAEPAPGDCQDQDPAAFPNALELVGDGTDQDCDGNPDAAAFAFAGWLWDRPSHPRVGRIGSTYVMALTARQIDNGGKLPLTEVGVTLTVPLSGARSGAVPLLSQFKISAEHPIADTVAMLPVHVPVDPSGDGTPDPTAWVVTTWTAATLDRNTYLHARPVYENGVTGVFTLGGALSDFTTEYTPGSVAVAINDAGDPYLFGCADDKLHVDQSAAPEALEDETPNLGDLCFVTSRPYASGTDEVVDFTRCTATQCRAYPLSRSTTLTVGPGQLTGEVWVDAYRHGDLQILLDGDDLVVRNADAGADYRLFTGQSPIAGDAAMVGAELFAAAIVDGGGGRRIDLVFGQYPTMSPPITMPFVHPDLDVVPEGIALHADADRVVIVVSARDRAGTPALDAVGWMFLGKP